MPIAQRLLQMSGWEAFEISLKKQQACRGYHSDIKGNELARSCVCKAEGLTGCCTITCYLVLQKSEVEAGVSESENRRLSWLLSLRLGRDSMWMCFIITVSFLCNVSTGAL